MKPTLLVLLLLLLALGSRATSISGGIYSSTTWTLSGSPYTMTGNMVVFDGVDLTIEPGVVIMVDSGVKLEIRGRIIANGTVSQPITFKASSSSAGQTWWLGIVFIGTSDPLGVGSQARFTYCNVSNARTCFDFDIAYHGPYIFKHCDFEYNYALNNDGGDGGMLFDSCSIKHNHTGFSYFQFGGRISNCNFDDNVYGVDGSDTLLNCTFINHSGIAVQPYGYAKGCTITNNNVAVRCYFNSVNNTFIHNTVTDNAEGVDMLTWFNGSINFTNNQICNNTAYNIRLNTANNCNLSNNCWCGADSATIRSKIIDGYVDISKGLVTIGATCSTTGIEDEPLATGADVYPNPLPANAWLNIRLNTAIATEDIQIVDVLGKKHSFEAHSAGQRCSLKLSEYAPGVYFLIIPAANGERVAKQVVVQ